MFYLKFNLIFFIEFFQTFTCTAILYSFIFVFCFFHSSFFLLSKLGLDEVFKATRTEIFRDICKLDPLLFFLLYLDIAGYAPWF